MKYSFYLFLSIAAIQLSCENQVVEAFKNLNQTIIDSIALYDSLNNRLFQEINIANIQSSEQEYITQVYFDIQQHNQFIDSVIALMNQNAVNQQDRRVSTKYLIKEGNANRIKKELNELVLHLESIHVFEIPEHAKQMFWSINDYNTDSGKTWAEDKFNNMPLMVTQTTLNRFKLNNTKASALILLDIKERMK